MTDCLTTDVLEVSKYSLKKACFRVSLAVILFSRKRELLETDGLQVVKEQTYSRDHKSIDFAANSDTLETLQA